jgi:hypothetical protein
VLKISVFLPEQMNRTFNSGIALLSVRRLAAVRFRNPVRNRATDRETAQRRAGVS